MKIRNGFVSNSSSSSFIVNKETEYTPVTIKLGRSNTYHVRRGEYEFGWGPEVISDINSKINFALFQAEYKGDDCFGDMLVDVIREFTGAEKVVFYATTGQKLPDLEYSKDTTEGQIDHQSCYPDNIEIFSSKKDLSNFLFNSNSLLILDNDNEHSGLRKVYLK